MKKLILFALLIAIAATFTFAAVQAPRDGSAAAASYACPNVGWNSRGMCKASAPDSLAQPLAIFVRPPVTPNVGWNS